MSYAAPSLSRLDAFTGMAADVRATMTMFAIMTTPRRDGSG